MCLAVPGRIIEITEEDPVGRMGKVDFAGVVKEVNLTFVPEAGPGVYVIVHVGFAISTVDEEEARKVFATLLEIEDREREAP